MWLGFNSPIWFYPKPIDFRKQLDGLILLVSDSLEMMPTSGHLFLFRNRSSNKLKMLWWDRNGFWLFYKRLEKGQFIFPGLEARVFELSRDQLSWLLSGLDCLKQPLSSEIKPTNFY
jgi:transposase